MKPSPSTFFVPYLKSTDIESKIASHIATAAPANKQVIIDPFCGVGGNTIAFALSGRWERVYAIEKDQAALACAKHNAEIYGVADQITFFHGDCFDILGLDDVDDSEPEVYSLRTLIGGHGVVFASPPWGGTYSCDVTESANISQGPDTRGTEYSILRQCSRMGCHTYTTSLRK
jgi:trimethylguanosine synthase